VDGHIDVNARPAPLYRSHRQPPASSTLTSIQVTADDQRANDGGRVAANGCKTSIA
jgi:hypothetical protein